MEIIVKKYVIFRKEEMQQHRKRALHKDMYLYVPTLNY